MVDIPYRSGGLDGDDWEELIVLISLVASPFTVHRMGLDGFLVVTTKRTKRALGWVGEAS